MTDFPNNFDCVIYGTGIVESILSAALSTTGHSVLHLDKNDYYGGYSGCFRLSELEKLLVKWKNSIASDDNDNIFTETEDYVKFVNYNWNVYSEIEINGNDDLILSNNWNEETIRKIVRGFEFEIFPRILFSESRTVDALIQSDVTRYLEFKFISKFATLNDDKIIPIPINRSDIVKTKVFSLRQKRQLTSFLEWCYTVKLNDDIVLKYDNKPLFELMRKEKNIDNFTEKIIIECMAMAPEHVETKKGISQIQRFLYSFNKFGPYPIMWPNYGCGEISQAFCRMSAVFGSIYSLNTFINSCNPQLTENGEYESSQESQIPVNYRKIKLSLSNGSDVYTDTVISHKSYLKPEFLQDIGQLRWISRCIIITDKSLIDGNRDHSDILLFPFHLEHIEKPVMLLEIPVERVRNEQKIDLFAVHITAFTDTLFDSKELFKEYIGKLFNKYNDSTDSLKPRMVFECYFTLPEFSNVSLDTKISNISNNLIFVNSSLSNMEFEECLKEANDLFSNKFPGVEFLPRPPNPEDIILLENEIVSSTNQGGGDFPFATNIQSNNDIINAPGDASTSTVVIYDNAVNQGNLEGLIVEMELNAASLESDERNNGE